MLDRRPLRATIAALVIALTACAHGPTPPPSARIHVVQRGETPVAIARRYEVSVDALMRINGIDDPTKLQVGERLVLPGRGDEAAASAAPPAGVSPPAGALPPAGAPPSVRPSPSPSPAARLDGPARELLGDGGGADRDRAPEASAPPQATTPPKAGVPAIPPPPPTPDLAAMRATFTRSPRAGKTKLLWPVEGVVVSLFGPREGQRHDGVDIGAPQGTAVWAAADGEVVFAGEQPGYGLLVVLAHDGDLATIYAHNAANLVAKGDRVRQGDPIAQVGQTGGTASPALHFEVRVAREPKNPLPLLPDD